MGLCRVTAYVTLMFVAIILAVIFVDPVQRSVIYHSHTKLSDANINTVGWTLFIADIVRCAGDAKGCGYNIVLWNWVVGGGYGWDEPGVSYLGYDGHPSIARHSHAAMSRATYDLKLQRSVDYFIGTNMSKLAKGFVPDEIRPTFLNLATDDPERLARRDLLAEAMVATQQLEEGHPSLPKFIAPAHVTANNSNKTNVHDVVGYNLFRQAFGVDLDQDELGMLYEWIGVMNKVAIGMGDPATAPRIAEISNYMEAKIKAGKIGQQYMAKATARKMDGDVRLKEVVLVLLFAGYGGTNVLVGTTLTKILSEPALIKAWNEKPDDVLLEGARMFPPVAGINPFVVREDTLWKLKNGKVYQEKKGDIASMFSNTAHHDPAVFGGPSKDPEYAKKFIPGRENADRILTWGNELRHIKECPSPAGCGKAPRPCPGTHLSYRLAKGAIDFFVKGLPTKPKAEL